MAKEIQLKVEGLASVKKLFADIGAELTGRQLEQVLKAGGRALARQMKQQVPFTGKVKRLLKKDIGVSNLKGSKDKPRVQGGHGSLKQPRTTQ